MSKYNRGTLMGFLVSPESHLAPKRPDTNSQIGDALVREGKLPTEYEDVIAVQTSKSLDQIISEGGTGAWVLNRKNARSHRFVVCVHRSDHPEENGSAFAVGRIKEIVTSPENPERWLIKFSEYAPIMVRYAWKGWRNPVRYTYLKELGIEPSSLKFQRMPMDIDNKNPSAQEISSLTVDQARKGLAKTFGVPVESIEITIKF